LNSKSGEMIAVKQIDIPNMITDEGKEKQRRQLAFLSSAWTKLSGLDHPNLVEYMGIEQTLEHFSIFMEYVPGSSLGSCVRKYQPKLENEAVKSFMSQILAGLEYLHSKGVWHWNLTIDNILISPEGTCKISDHILSEQNEEFKRLRKSLYWLAPELGSSSSQYTAKADIWSLGYVWQHMYLGERPLWSPDLPLGAPPPLPEGATLPDDTADFRIACFTADPERRPSASDLRAHGYLLVPAEWTFQGLRD